MKSEDQIREDWYQFADRAFIEWRGGSRKTLTDFAEWIGIPQPLMSRQTKRGGSIPQDQRIISAWVNRYGSKIYEVLGLPLPEDPIDALPEPTRSIALEIRETLAEYKVAGDSPKALELQEEILKKHGLEIISKKV